MKTAKILFLICALCATGIATGNSQVRVNVNVNLQPSWGPASYDYAEYYYLPEVGVYYSVPERLFIYPNGNSWKFVKRLPQRYSHVDLYSTYKVVVNEPKPYLRNKYYVEHYNDYRNKHQENRRDFKGDNGKHKGWDKNGRSNGNDRADRKSNNH